MANTYSKLHVHLVIIVKYRAPLIKKRWKTELYKYITGIVTNKNQKMLIINGVENHIHILLGLKTNCCIDDIARDIKSNSSRWINENKLIDGKFEWQKGYGAFSVGAPNLKTIINYIARQEEHHRKDSLESEYTRFIEAEQIERDKKYMFDS